MKRILVGVDGSKEARVAEAQAAELASSMGGRLVIACAVPPTVTTEGAPELIARAQELEALEAEQATEITRKAAEGIARPGLDVETRVISGSPATALAELARTEDFDLIVVGHRGRGTLSRVLLGSVADRLVQIATKPVLVAR